MRSPPAKTACNVARSEPATLLGRRTQCAHLFHEECLFPWLRQHGTCPVCRYDIEPEQSQPLPPSLQAEMERVASRGVPAWTATGSRDENLPGGRMWLAASERGVHLRVLDAMVSAALVDLDHEIRQHERITMYM